jgi:hypothetical protein
MIRNTLCEALGMFTSIGRANAVDDQCFCSSGLILTWSAYCAAAVGGLSSLG